MEFLIPIGLGLIAIALFAMLIFFVKVWRFKNSTKAQIEGKFFFESKRIVWRITNLGARDISIVEIGIMCKDKVSSYRPLYSSEEDINNIPHMITRGDIASYRKEMERFAFKQSENEELRVSNPYLYFYAKDAEGKIYKSISDTRFGTYLSNSR